MKTLSKYLLASALLMPLFTQAQNDQDALRYSQTSIAGTARFTGMGGAFGALGGDFSAIGVNPAGIALYRKSEFTFSPSFYKEKTTSDYSGSSRADSKYNFNIPNVGYVFSYRLTNNDTSPGWKNWNFGMGYNRTNNFHSQSLTEGVNNDNSLLDNYLETLNQNGGISESQLPDAYAFDAGLAYLAHLVDTNSGDPLHYHSVLPGGGALLRRTMTTKGSTGEVLMAFGGNYSNRLYLGATLGINTLSYTSDESYQEVDDKNTIPGFKQFTVDNNIQTSGVGVNLKFGMIFKVNDFVRLGAAVHTPSFYSMHDDYSTHVKSQLDANGNYIADSPHGSFDYDLTTPLRATGSVAFVIGKMGLLSADYEFVDYSESKLNSSQDNFFDANDNIRKKYTTGGNLHIGTEWRYEGYSVRGGFAMYDTPFNSSSTVSGADQSKMAFTGGFGVRDKDYFFDVAYAYSTSKEYYKPYSLTSAEVQGAKNKFETHNITLTFGFRF